MGGGLKDETELGDDEGEGASWSARIEAAAGAAHCQEPMERQAAAGRGRARGRPGPEALDWEG